MWGCVTPGFDAVAFVVFVIPGPSVLFIIGPAPAHGRRVAILPVPGNASGMPADEHLDGPGPVKGRVHRQQFVVVYGISFTRSVLGGATGLNAAK